MTFKKIISTLILCSVITSTGCVYQAELTEFLDDPTGMKAEAEMTAEYESPPDDTEYELYENEYEETTDTAEPLITELPQVTDITETIITTTTVTTTVTDITESAEEETEITTSAETEDIIFASAEPTEETEPTEEAAEWEEPTEQHAEEETESPAEEPTKTASEKSDYQKALEIYEYMTVNGVGTCVQHSYQTFQMCREYGLQCYFIWTENKLYSHVANAVCVEGVWYVLDTQAGCFLTENMCGFTEIVDENETYIMSADVISPIRYEYR